MTILCLTGWQQPANALAVIAPRATHFDYSGYSDAETMFMELPKEPDLAIGWSFGAQLLARAVAGGHTKPGELLLVGPVFQQIADARFVHGPTKEMFAALKQSYKQHPEAMLAQLHALIGLGDTHARRIIRTLGEGLELWSNGAFWLEELGTASCAELDFAAFPKTTIVHGINDKVIDPVNAQAFADRLPQAEMLLWPNCAHAPHLHNPEALRQRVEQYV
jgi:pimeloyl-[acyl-carrier protein] methyl ester esterase